VALALEVKEILAVLVFALRASRSVKAAVAEVLAVEVQPHHPQAGLVLAVEVFPTPFEPDHLRLMAAVAVVARLLTLTLPADQAVVAEGHLDPAARQLLVRQIPVAAAVVEPPTGHKMLLAVALVSWWFATALLNFSTGETHETIDSGHHCGTDLDGLRHKPRRLLQGR